jgi:hypothetical protein
MSSARWRHDLGTMSSIATAADVRGGVQQLRDGIERGELVP